MPANAGSDQSPPKDFFRPLWHNKWHEWQERARRYPVYTKVLRAILNLARRSTPMQVPTSTGLVTVPVGSMFGTRRRIAAEASCSVKSVGRALPFWKQAKVIKYDTHYEEQERGAEGVKCLGLVVTVLDWNSVVVQRNGGSAGQVERPRRERAAEEGEQPATQSPGEGGALGTEIDPATLTFEKRDWDRYRAIFAAVPENLPDDQQDEWDKAHERLLDEQKKFLRERAAAEARGRAAGPNAQDSPS